LENKHCIHEIQGKKQAVCMKINSKLKVICLMMLLLVLSISPGRASSIGDRVLSDISITREGQNIEVKVSFNFPVRYLRHYPLDYGKEVNIQLEPVLVGADNAGGLLKRESLSAPDNNQAGLVRVDYEGRDLAKPTIRVVLDKARKYDVKQGEDYRSLVVVLPMEEKAGQAMEARPAKTAAKEGRKMQSVVLTPQRQDELLKAGTEAMAAEQYMRAVLIYTELLDSEDPEVRELAQFTLATAQEHAGHMAHARAEYKNYLQEYPDGKNAGPARERLNALMSDQPVMPGAQGETAGGWVIDYFGSVSEYYDYDKSLFEEGKDVENISSLFTGFNANWRAKSDRFKTEAVAVGSYELSFLKNKDDLVRVNRLYMDFADIRETFISRVGRQASSKGGVLTRFDGGNFGYLLTDRVRVNVVAGYPVNLPYDGVDTDRYFYGLNFDLGRFFDHWDFNAYIINQIADDVDDRRAVGGEARFIGQRSSFYSLLDYDIIYDEVSVFLFTGNYLLPNDKTRFTFQWDYRGVPILSTSNALIGQISPSLDVLEDVLGEDEVRRLAEDRTLDSHFATVGVSQPITDNIQIAGDISWSKIDGSSPSGGVDAFESTGDEFFYFLQLIGSGLIKEGDVSSTGLRYADTKYRDIYTFTVNTRYPMYARLWISPRLEIDYRENKLQPGDQWRFIPGLNLEYTFMENWLFEIDGEYRFANEELPGVADGKDGYTFTAGIRWDF